jgi:hypothetical protein
MRGQPLVPMRTMASTLVAKLQGVLLMTLGTATRST